MNCLLSVLLLATTAFSEQYSFDFSKAGSAELSQNSQRLDTRMLLDASEPCLFVGAKLVCRYSFGISGDKGETIVNFEAQCEADSQVGFDYRKAQSCSCLAEVILPDPDSPKKVCPCTVCQAGFGENPINVDCSMYENSTDTTTSTESTETDSSVVLIPNADVLPAAVTEEPSPDPYIVNSCTSLDCSGACNGTCALNCASSDKNCLYCANNAANQPTIAPTGQRQSINNIGEPTVAPAGDLSCFVSGPNVVCQDDFAVNSGTEHVQFEAVCDANAQVGFDYRKAQNCECMAAVTSTADPTSPTKMCPCTICEAGVEGPPISVDCSSIDDDDPFMLNSCIPSDEPSGTPSATPSSHPTTAMPSDMPSLQPSLLPSKAPSTTPSESPTLVPSTNPSQAPTQVTSAGANGVGSFCLIAMSAVIAVLV